ncbi:TetR/AcrR family transcriptional regulator [Acidithrix ferrooxidans]|uniref:DNA-binding transcriptional repressor AcrR n=1 Tax=Acidithrix ferrooxidans TaxID=1280514 RepID=A0A0D8HI62_9ACTN|nr:DNA-binding transcriptional repressor AcrR [Acidithrix ferrooxidans]
MRLSRQDWAEAALRALEEGGPDAVAVLPIAHALATTRGSFYWHFTNRADLLEVALQRWESRSTDALIERLSADPNPRIRLRRLFEYAFSGDHDVVEISLAAHASRPEIAVVLERVATKRANYLEACFSELGFSDAAARGRGLVAYATYLGWLQLRRSAPSVLSDEDANTSIAKLLERLLIQDPGDSDTTTSTPQ